ncbi:hypothetical protein GCM10011352_05900 [Marinobacterium zhoushanense]|uniref:Uncharacterized protein n=1 Tax=Marinobacterium zhoushanense TaxID=1679163 RepID=A0ABQ1K118_9GAMM|nr:amine oxidase [Marinobacterium zhoushanense]GGB82897.1 hypothetical protein GCM10011352_05900 [Marinobacterium zhoushanense]
MPLTELQNEIAAWRQRMKRDYDRSVNRDLSKQNSGELMLRNLTGILKQGYDLVLVKPGLTGLRSESDRAAVLHAFEGAIDELLEYAVTKHRTSCALSNFPDEHKPSLDYIAKVLQAAATDWDHFTCEVSARCAAVE